MIELNVFNIHLGQESEQNNHKNQSGNSLGDQQRVYDFHHKITNREYIKQLLDEEMPPDIECAHDNYSILYDDECQNSPLHHAAYVDCIEVINLLLSFGATINKEGDRGETPLHLAAEGGCVRAINLLISNGATVNKKDMYDRTPLHRAAHCTKAQPLSVLLQYGADVHALDQNGKTALDYAQYWGRKETIQILEDYGASSSLS